MGTKGLIKFATIAALVLTASITPNTTAEEPLATSVGTSLAQNYIGEWLITFKMGERAINFDLLLKDINGKLGGTLDSAQQPEPKAIDAMDVTDEGDLIMDYELSFGSQSFKIKINAALAEAGLEGTIVESSGLFEGPFTAVPKEADPEAEGQRRRNRRGAANMTRIRLGDDDNLRITFSPIKADSDDHGRLEELGASEVFGFVGGRATKLFTDVDMVFPEATVKTENAAPNYPGVYSLWLKKTADGWNLVFNEEADIWGTMHNADADAAEVSLVSSKLDEPSETFKVKLEKTEGGGQVIITWGDDQWTADFTS